jgi:hypothetical protein
MVSTSGFSSRPPGHTFVSGESGDTSGVKLTWGVELPRGGRRPGIAQWMNNQTGGMERRECRKT